MFLTKSFVLKPVGYVEGYLSTSDLDLQGDIIVTEAIENMAKQIKLCPLKRVIYLEHDITKPVGRILKYKVHRKGSWSGLWAKVAIFQEEIYRKIENGELTGFSIAGRVLKYERRNV